MPSTLPLGSPWPKDNLIPARDSIERSFHAYLHIPFCVSRCGYCDFNTYTSEELNGDLRGGFDGLLVREIELSKQVLTNSGYSDRKLSSVFFGGGTPSLFTHHQFRAVLDALGEKFGFEPGVEITTEANPESTTPELLTKLSEYGVNRLSMGVQSFDAQVLKVLDRSHSKDHVAPLVKVARDLGLEISVDLIFGAPGESLESWQRTVESALALETDHISAYSLIVEPGTALERKIRRGEIEGVNEDLNAEKYELATEAFEGQGLSWYEVSNWGKPSKHNGAYWLSQDWWGYGPGAHSHLAGNRFWNKKHPTAYAQSLIEGVAVQALEQLTEQQQLEERLMLGLRTSTGVTRELLKELGVSTEKVASYLGKGLITLSGESVVVTKAGRLLVDGIVLDFLS